MINNLVPNENGDLIWLDTFEEFYSDKRVPKDALYFLDIFSIENLYRYMDFIKIYDKYKTDGCGNQQKIGNAYFQSPKVSIYPRVKYRISKEEYKKLKLEETKRIQLGEYPQELVSSELKEILEEEYNSGNISLELKPNRKYTNYDRKNLIGYSQEYIYKGNKYMRYTDGFGCSEWKIIQPISFDILSKEDDEGDYILSLRTTDKFPMQFPYFHDSVRTYVEEIEEFVSDKNWEASSLKLWLNRYLVHDLFDVDRMREDSIIVEESCEFGENNYLDFDKIILKKGFTNSFLECHFRYIYEDENGNVVLSRNKPENEKIEVFDLSLIQYIIPEFNSEDFWNFKSSIRGLERLGKICQDNDFRFPIDLLWDLAKTDLLTDFVENGDFKHFIAIEKELRINEMLTYVEDIAWRYDEKLNPEDIESEYKIPTCYDDYVAVLEDDDYTVYSSDYNESELVKDFYYFAIVLGCFSKLPYTKKDGSYEEKEGKPVPISQLACSSLYSILKSGAIDLKDIHGYFDNLDLNIYPNFDLYRFLTNKEGAGKNLRFPNIELIKSFSERIPSTFGRIINNFEDISNRRRAIDGTTGRIASVPWNQAIIKYFEDIELSNVTEENEDIAIEILKNGLNQEQYEQAVEWRDEGKSKRVPEHILGKEITEKSILEQIQQIQEQIEGQLSESKDIIESLWGQKFTYEWLSKNDPRNACIGLYVDCCATVDSHYYGKNIAKATMTDANYQNLVIYSTKTDKTKGDIIAKGTIYMNPQNGYGVFNDFEMAENYRKSGQSKKEIFDKIMQGINAFIVEYNKIHDKNPIKQINVGLGYNKLRSLCEEYEKERGYTNYNKNLKVPECFRDAMDGQIVLYVSPKEQNRINKLRNANGERDV